MRFATTHCLFQVKYRLRRSTGQTRDALTDEILHALCDVSLFEERCPVTLGSDQLVKLFNLVAEFDRERVRLQLTGVTNSLHLCIPEETACP
jgi:hypothetical protein